MSKIKLLIVISNYYEDISNNLLNSSTKYLNNINISYDIIKVLGSLEIPQIINYFLDNTYDKNSLKYKGFVALGCVIKGETYHFEIVSNEANRNLMNLALRHSIPIGNGIITAFNHKQALDRSHKKGIEATKACIDLINLKDKIIKKA